jgi:hypothetical protein
MKIKAVKDATGKVIATFEAVTGGGPSVMPVLEAGHSIAEIEVPDHYKTDVKGLYERLNAGAH